MKSFGKTVLIVAVLLAALHTISGATPQLLKKHSIVDRITIVKSTRTMTLESNGKMVKTYNVALGGHPLGPKQQQGDHRTPEGIYFVDAKNPQSQFYMALHVSYPSSEDRRRARKAGMRPGGDVEIHGLGKQYGWIGARH